MRVPEGECLRWGLSADAEALAWLPALDTGFVVSTEDGTVAAFDARGGRSERRPPPPILPGALGPAPPPHSHPITFAPRLRSPVPPGVSRQTCRMLGAVRCAYRSPDGTRQPFPGLNYFCIRFTISQWICLM